MSLASGGFVFLILPIISAVYYVLNDKLKPWCLILFSAFFLWDIAGMPYYFLLNIFINWIVLLFCEKKSLYSAVRQKLNLVLFAKDCSLLIWFFICRYVQVFEAVPTSAFVVTLLSLFGIHASCEINGEQGIGGMEYLKYVLFFPKFYGGPFELPKYLKNETKKLKFFSSSCAQGIMMFTSGLAKKVIIARHLEIIAGTLLKYILSETTILSVWFLCFIYALQFYFTVSAYGDMARGIAGIFSVKLPQITYFPLQAPTVRDYIYRFNMGLEQSLGEIIYGKFNRDTDIVHGYIVSAMVVILFSGIFAFVGITPMWSLSMLILLVLDYFILRKISVKFPVTARITTFLLTLSTFVFISSASLKESFMLLKTMLWLNNSPFFTDSLFYLSLSDGVILVLASVLALSLMETVSRIMKKQFSKAWWILSALISMGVLAFCASFILLEVV